jgi:hypothetical protein
MLHLQINRPGQQLGKPTSRERDVRSDLISTPQSSVMSAALTLSGAWALTSDFPVGLASDEMVGVEAPQLACPYTACHSGDVIHIWIARHRRHRRIDVLREELSAQVLFPERDNLVFVHLDLKPLQSPRSSSPRRPLDSKNGSSPTESPVKKGGALGVTEAGVAPARFPTSARGDPSDSRPCEDLGRTFDLAARFNHGASEPGLKCLGRNHLFRHDAHLDKLRPNASHGLRDPSVEGRAFTAANQNFAEEIRNRQPGVRKVLDQPIG